MRVNPIFYLSDIRFSGKVYLRQENHSLEAKATLVPYRGDLAKQRSRAMSVTYILPNGKTLKFANQRAVDSYIRKLVRKQSRLASGKTLSKSTGFTLDPRTQERVESGKYQPESKYSRIKHGKVTTERFAKN